MTVSELCLTGPLAQSVVCRHMCLLYDFDCYYDSIVQCLNGFGGFDVLVPWTG
jgi:hypothetical protein